MRDCPSLHSSIYWPVIPSIGPSICLMYQSNPSVHPSIVWFETIFLNHKNAFFYSSMQYASCNEIDWSIDWSVRPSNGWFVHWSLESQKKLVFFKCWDIGAKKWNSARPDTRPQMRWALLSRHCGSANSLILAACLCVYVCVHLAIPRLCGSRTR